MKLWQEKAKEYRFNQGLPWRIVAEKIKDEFFPEESAQKIYERVRGYLRWQPEYKENKNIIHVPIKRSVSYKNGITEYQDERPYKGELTPLDVMKEHNLNPCEWEVVSFTSNYWQSQTKEGQLIDLCQSKLAVKPKVKSELTFEDIDNYFASKDFNCKTPLKPFPYNPDGEILEIDYTDLHVGLLAWKSETGADFDLKIVEQRFLESIADTVRRCQNRKFKLIRFITLGDILHIDNDEQKTTNGTFQQADGRTAKIFNKALDMLIAAIDCLLELEAPIEYVYLAGNHDRTTGYFLAKSLQMAYRKEPNITFDIEPNPQKVKSYGRALVGYCHGDMPRKNIGLWLLKDFRREYGASDYAEIHSGHIHTKTEEEINGIRVITLSSLCESAYWEHQQGYVSERALICYVWHEKHGKRETWVTNF